MCECGCTSNDERYKFPGPEKSFYILTLHGACTNCDSPPGFSIERFNPGDFGHRFYGERDHYDGPLKFEKWPDGMGIGTACGFQKHEFVKALLSHLVGIDSKELGEKGKIDKDGAEVILEEMYEDACFRPTLFSPVSRAMRDAPENQPRE